MKNYFFKLCCYRFEGNSRLLLDFTVKLFENEAVATGHSSHGRKQKSFLGGSAQRKCHTASSGFRGMSSARTACGGASSIFYDRLIP